MNERINELIKSTNYWYAETNSKADWRLLNGVGEMEWNQKFAELIVAECAEHLESSVLVPNSEHSRVKWKCIRAIKEHFGVEL